MSTNSSISIVNQDTQKIHTIYCHWDGYLDWNGKILKEQFNSYKEAFGLIENGDLSSINEDGSVVSYHKDRQEDWVDVQPQISDNIAQAMKCFEQEYNYLFKDNAWKLVKTDSVLTIIEEY